MSFVVKYFNMSDGKIQKHFLSSSIFLSLGELKDFAETYGIETSALEVECSLLKIQISQTNPEVSSLADFGCYLLSHHPAHHTVYELVQIALTITVTSTESERSFSTMKSIKTRLRTRMTENRLSDLSILSIEKEIAQELQDKIIDTFDGSVKKK